MRRIGLWALALAAVVGAGAYAWPPSLRQLTEDAEAAQARAFACMDTWDACGPAERAAADSGHARAMRALKARGR